MMMIKSGMTFAILVSGFVLFQPAEASANSCFHSWAVPGTYTISGKFRDRVESAGARLTRDCRVTIRVPGVYSGTRVARAGKCLHFSFKVKGVRKSFTAKWCNRIGYIPWKGRSIRAHVQLVRRVAASGG
jgi:hypothetical protein